MAEAKHFAPAAMLVTLGLVAAVGLVIRGVLPDKPATVEPSTTTNASTPTPSVKPYGQTVVEWPDCGYALPTCVRLEGKQWYLINDYQGDKRPVTLVSTIVRGDITYRRVRLT